MIYHYKYFESDLEFEKFQQEHKINFIQISPMNTFKMDESNADGNKGLYAFVVFRYQD